MAEYQVIDKITHDAELKSIGDSIRAKGGTTAPFNSAAEMKAAVDAIQTGGGGDHTLEDALLEDTITDYTNNRITFLRANFFQGSIIKSVTMENLLTMRGGVFSHTGLETVSFPKLEKCGYNKEFANCAKLSELVLPKIRITPEASNSGVKKIDFGSPIMEDVFPPLSFHGYMQNIKNLTTVILRPKNMMYPLRRNDIFKGSAIESGTGYIYVPKALVDQYKVATNWVTYASQIRAIEDYPEITGG